MLLPEGLTRSPYDVLDYQAQLTLHDAGGRWATFRRLQTVRFVQDGVSAILDHAWGNGMLLTHYRHSAGSLEGSLKDGEVRHPVIALQRPMRRGDTLAFEVERTAVAGFTENEEWLETTIDHPIRRLSQRIVFPIKRPCRGAGLALAGAWVRLPVAQRSDGTTEVRFSIDAPEAHAPYTVRWSW